MTPLPRQKGSGSGVRFSPTAFTLIEMMLVMIIIGLISSILVPILASPFQKDQRLETIREMTAIVEAVYGRGDLGDFGYLSSMGGLPPQMALDGAQVLTVSALYKQPADAQDPASLPGLLNPGAVPAGWNGPYLRSFSPDPVKDSWGMNYHYDFNTSDPTQWRITSRGPDRLLNTTDDLVLPSKTSWFTTTGTLDVSLNLAAPQRRIAPIPDDYLAPRVGGSRSPVPITVYLPLATSNARVACLSGAPDARCTGICEVVDANGTTTGFASDTAMQPFRVQCHGAGSSSGMPYGIHHMTMTFPAGTVYADGTRTYQTNIVVNRPKGALQLVVGGDVQPAVDAPQWTTNPQTYSGTPAGGVMIASVTGGPTSLAAQVDKPIVATLRFTGTMLLTDDTTQCGVELKTTGPALSPVPSKQIVQAWGAVTAAARVPFTYEYTLRQAANGAGIDLTQLKLQLTRVAGSGDCTLSSLTATTLRYVQR